MLVDPPSCLHALRQSGLLDPRPDPPFDRMAALAARFVAAPVALITLGDHDRQVIKGSSGMSPQWRVAGAMPAPFSAVPHARGDAAALVIADAASHPLTRGSPALGEGVAAYAGFPLTWNGDVVGTICVLDDRPRNWTDDELDILSGLASATQSHIDGRVEVAFRQQTEERLRILLEASDEALVLHDAGRIVGVTGGFSRLVGQDPQALLGRGLHDLLTPESPVRAAERAEAESEAPYLARLAGADGAGIDAEVIPRPQRDDSSPIRAVAVRAVREPQHAEAQHAEAQHRERESRFLGIFETSRDGFFITELDGAILDVNPAVSHVSGYSREELRGMTVTDIYAGPMDRARFEEAIRCGGGVVQDFETRMRTKGGGLVDVLISASVRRDGAGQIVGYHGIIHDVSARKRAEAELHASHALLQTVVEGTPDAIFAKDVEGRFLLINRAGAELMGRSPAEVIGRTDEELVPPETARLFREADRRVIERGEVTTGQETSKLGVETRSFHVVKAPIFGPGGEVIGLVGISRDVSEREAVERERRALMAALAQSEAHYRRLVETSPQAIYALDARGRFTEVNPATIALLERPAEELFDRPFADVIAPESLPHARAVFERLMDGEIQSLETELSIVRPSGDVRRIRVDATAIVEDGRVVGNHGSARDITDEREREAQMRLFAAALENLEESVNVLDQEGRILYSNAALCRMLGCEFGRWPQDGLLHYAADEASRATLSQALSYVRDAGAWRGRLKLRHDSGAVLRVESHMERVEQDGRVTVFSICRDITSDLETEQRLRRAERLASIGTLVGGVAHELNNPLAAIMGFTQLLLLDQRPTGEKEDLETIRREAERMAEIVSNLRLLARGTQSEDTTRELVDVNDVVRHILRTRGYALRTQNISVREDLAALLPPVSGVRSHLEQVVLNLVVNAEQAMAALGRPGLLVVRTRQAPDGVSIHVIDDGPGIRPEDLDRIFDPFFTTKSPGAGTGLGLSLVHNLVAEHGGRVLVESTMEAGTTFRVVLPAAAAAGVRPPVVVADAGAAAPMRILVVDDDEPVRRSIARYLARRGHQVDEAAEGEAALSLLESRSREGRSHDVILSDVRMPGLDGRQLLARLREGGAGLERRLIFLTGATGADASGEDDHGAPVLRKPIDLGVLARAVESMLTRR